MVNNSKVDVLMLFGVEGGSSITSGSGQDIYNDIKNIVEAIQNDITKQLQFGVSTDALNNLKSQIETAVTETLTSIKGTPVELTFSFDQKSIDKAFREVKQQLKEQNITISAQPQEKKQGTGSTGSAGGANESVKKESEEIANAMDQAIDGAIQKIKTRFGEGSADIIRKLEAFKEQEKRAFSTDEVEMFSKAIDFSNGYVELRSVIELFENINKEAQDTTTTIQKLQAILSKPYTKSGIDTTQGVHDIDRELGEISTIKNYLKSRHVAKSKLVGYQVKEDLLQNYLTNNNIDIRDFGNYDSLKDFMEAISKAYPELLQYEAKEGEVAKLTIKSFEDIDKYINEQTSQMQQANSEAEQYAQTFEKIINAKGLQKGDFGQLTLNVDQLRDIIAEFPEAQQYLQKYITDIEKSLSDEVPNSVQEMSDTFSSIGQEAQTAFDSIENGIKDVSEAEGDLQNKMQSLNSDTADEAIDRVTESIEAQNDALRENTEAIEENQQAQKKAENTIPKSYLNDINKLNASQTVMSSRQGYDKVSTGASKTLGDINAIYQAIHDDNYDNVQAIGIENYTQAIEKLGQLLPLAKEQLKQTGKELDALDKKAEKAEADTAKANAKLKANAEKAEEAERKLASQLDVTIAKATARRDVLKSALTNIDDSQFKIRNPDNTKNLNDNVNSVSKLITKLEEYYSIVSTGKDIPENFWDDVDDVDSLTSAVKKLNSTLSITEANLKSVGIDTANIPTDAAVSAINKFNEALRQFKVTSGANQYQDLFGLSEMVGLGDKSLEYVIAETQRLTTATRQLSAANREEQNVITQRNKIYQEADNYYKKYQSGIRANIALNQRWQETLKKLHDGGFSDNESARRALAELQTATKDANAETMTLWGSLKKLFTDHFGSVSATAFIGTLRNVLRGAYQNVLEIDKAMTELRKVTDLTEQQYESFQARVADTAREVGGSIADTIRSTADYSRLGFNLPDSESLAKAALVYKNVGDGLENIDEASESIISTIKAFSDVNASDAMSIIDKFNEVGNNFAISSAGIGTALEKSAAALASANNTLDESIALITAGNTVVQNPEIIGTTMKTISMFLRASKTEAEEAGIEIEGMAESVSKLRAEIKSLSGVDIMLDDENYKSTYQILKEISEVWSEISDVSQANILERLGGKRNANVVASVIENFDVAEQSLQTSLNAAGSALAENEKFLDSIAGHINKLTVAYEDLSQTVINSDLVKIVVDGLTLVTNGLSAVVKNAGTLPTLISLIAGSLSAFKDVGVFHVSDMQNIFSGKISNGINGINARFTKNIIPDDINTKVKDLTVEFQNLGNATEGTARSLDEILEDAENLGGHPLASKFSDLAKEGKNAQVSIDGVYAALLDGNTKGISNVSNIVKTFNEMSDPKDQMKFADAVGQTNVNLGNYLRNTKNGKASTVEYTSSLAGAKLKTIGLTAATAALNAAISLGIGLLVNLVVEGFDRAINGLSQAVGKVEELASTVKNSQSEWKSLNDELATTKKRISELSDVESPTLFEKDELNRLKEYNDELERRRKLLEYENIVKVDEYNKAAQEAWAILTGTSFRGSGGLASLNTVLFQQNDITYYKELLDEYKQVKEDYSNGLIDSEDYESLQDIYESKIKEYQNKLANYRSQYSKILLGLNPDDPNNETAINYLNYLTNQIDTLFGDISTYGSTFEEIWNNAEFATITNDLSELAKQGELTEDTFNNVSGIEKFKQALESIGLTDIAEVIDTITRSVNDDADAFKNAAGSYDEYIANIAELKKSYDDIASKQKTLQSAYDKINSGTALTSTEFLELLEIYPQLYDSFTRVEEGYTLTADSIIAANSHINESLRQSVDQQIEDLRRARSAYESWRRDNEDTSGSSVDSLISSIGGLFSGENNWGEIFETGSQLIQNSFNKVEPPITEDVYNQYGEQINYLTVLMDSLNLSTKATSDEIEDFGTVLKDYSANVSLGVSAQKEMNENSRLSASTIESILALDKDYIKSIQLENGVIKFNTEAFKEVTKAKLKDKIAELELAKAEAIRIRIEDANNGNEHWKELEADIADVNLQLQITKSLYDNLEIDWQSLFDNNGSDTIDSNYKKRLEEIKDVNKGTIEDEKRFVNSWKALNEELYKTTDPDKYEENLREISEYIKGLDGLLDTYLEKWSKVNSYDENSISSRITRLAEARSVNYETYGNPNSLFYNLDTYEKNEVSLFGYEADTAKLRYDRGLIEYQDFINDVKRIRESARDRDGNYLLDMSFVSNYEDLDRYFNERLEVLRSFNDKSLDDEDDFVRQWKALNDEIYEGVDNTKYESNLKEILNYEKDLLDRRRKEGLISYENYRKGLIKLQNDNDALLGEDVLNEWLVSAANSEKEELDRLYKEGKTLAKDYFDYVCALVKENEDILDQRTIEEWTEDAWKSRAETEKTYWEQQKELASQYYDAEIKALQDVQKEEEKLSRAEELRLNLIKARQKLEEAKSQNNQLVFYNGEFEYMADQDAIMSAEEEVAESLKAIKENELQEQIDLLEQQKDEALLFYSNVIGLLEYYINGTMEIDSSDGSLIEKAMGSESGQYYMRLFNNEITPDEIKESLKTTFTKKDKDDVANSSYSGKIPAWAEKILGLDVADIFNTASSLVGMTKIAGVFSNIGASAQDILKSATNNILNTNETKVDQSVNVGDINMTIQGGTSQDMIDQFAKQLGSAIQASAQLYAF